MSDLWFPGIYLCKDIRIIIVNSAKHIIIYIYQYFVVKLIGKCYLIIFVQYIKTAGPLRQGALFE